MGRPKKTDIAEVVNPEVEEVLDEQTNPEVEGNSKITEEPLKETEQKEESVKETETKKELPANVIEKMRLYPQYEELWITPHGFVHPVGVPQYLLKDAKLYKNEFYNK